MNINPVEIYQSNRPERFRVETLLMASYLQENLSENPEL